MSACVKKAKPKKPTFLAARNVYDGQIWPKKMLTFTCLKNRPI